MERKKTSLAILGGGPLGNVSASIAFGKGVKDVLLIEKREHLGGTCLNVGCIPTKALIESAHVLNIVRKAGEFGIGTGAVSFDYRKISQRKDRIVNHNRRLIMESVEKEGYGVIHGTGRLEDEHTLIVEKGGGDRVEVEFDKLLLACGSKTFIPPIDGLIREDIFTSTDLLGREELPESIAIVGGGPIGVEFASMLDIFGVEVAMIEMVDHLLFREDEDVSALVEESFKNRGIGLFLGRRLERMERTGDMWRLYLTDKNGNTVTTEPKKVLMAVGRVPNIEDIGLEKAGVETDGRFVKVNEYLQTSMPHIFAGGDVVKGYQLAHMAYYHAPLVMENMLSEEMRPISNAAVPRVIYTIPEVGAVGLTEGEARAEGIEVRVAKTGFDYNSRARIMDETEGFVKILADRKTGKIIGSSIVGPFAGELIQEMVYVIRSGGDVEMLRDTLHAHPTLVGLLWDVADGL